MAAKHQPQRTCVVCRQKQNKRDLIRLVITDTGLKIDESGKASGRGAYLCDTSECWERASSTQILAKALRAEISDNDRMILRQMKSS